jgi:hypothetical protein
MKRYSDVAFVVACLVLALVGVGQFADAALAAGSRTGDPRGVGFPLEPVPGHADVRDGRRAADSAALTRPRDAPRSLCPGVADLELNAIDGRLELTVADGAIDAEVMFVNS